MTAASDRRIDAVVSGVGTLIGYGIVRGLRSARPGVRLLGLDWSPNAVGGVLCDVFRASPPVADVSVYETFLADLLDEFRPRIYIPGFEEDCRALVSLQQLFRDRQVALCLNRPELIELCSDKWAFYEAARGAGLSDLIPTYRPAPFADLVASCGLPFVVKKRTSNAGRGFLIVRDEKAYDTYRREQGDATFVAQPFLAGGQEYTVALFGDGEGSFYNHIALSRTLDKQGFTASGEVVSDPGLERQVRALAQAFRPLGPTNVQFMGSDGRFCLLEVNPRFSSTVGMRQGFGYNDVEMAYGFYVDGARPGPVTVRRGRAVRLLTEHYQYDGDHR